MVCNVASSVSKKERISFRGYGPCARSRKTPPSSTGIGIEMGRPFGTSSQSKRISSSLSQSFVVRERAPCIATRERLGVMAKL